MSISVRILNFLLHQPYLHLKQQKVTNKVNKKGKEREKKKKKKDTIGSHIFSALLGSDARDPYKNWFAANLLSHIVKDNDKCKELLLNSMIHYGFSFTSVHFFFFFFFSFSPLFHFFFQSLIFIRR